MDPPMVHTNGSMTQSEMQLAEPRVKQPNPDGSLLPYRCAYMPFYLPHVTASDLRLSRNAARPQCSTKPRNSRYQAFTSVSQTRYLSPVSAMNEPATRLPTVEAMTAVISRALPDVSIERLRPMSYFRPQRDITVNISGGRTLMLTLPPSSMLRLLRSEQWLLLSEALVIPWICGRASENTTKDKRTSIQYLIEADASGMDGMNSKDTEAEPNGFPAASEPLLKFLPKLLAHTLSSHDLCVAFNLTEPTRGLSISSLANPLSDVDRAIVNHQKGQFIRHISSLRASNSNFGPVVAVIGSKTSGIDSGGGATSVGSGGVDSWANAFLALVESTLRDGEDLAVTISYSLIRYHMNRLCHLLDAVTQSRLVVLDAGADTNVLVTRSTRPAGQVQGARTSKQEVEAPTQTHKVINTGANDEHRNRIWDVNTEPTKTENSQKAGPRVPGGQVEASQTEVASDITVTGLRDWSNCIFGDPLMTSILSENPSPELLRGFRQQPLRFTTSASTTAPRVTSPPPDDLVEDRENAPIRLLLYECYHATVSVVKQFYRPTWPDGTRREMEARRRLAVVLNKLAEVDENAPKRPRTTNPDIWPAKKSKSESDEASDTA